MSKEAQKSTKYLLFMCELTDTVISSASMSVSVDEPEEADDRREIVVENNWDISTSSIRPRRLVDWKSSDFCHTTEWGILSDGEN